jgi:hypothetical protein
MPPLNIRALLYAAIAWPHIPSIEELAAERKKTVEQLWKNVHAALGWARLALAALHIAAAPRPGSRVQGWCNVAYAAVFLESVTIPLHSFGSDDTTARWGPSSARSTSRARPARRALHGQERADFRQALATWLRSSRGRSPARHSRKSSALGRGLGTLSTERLPPSPEGETSRDPEPSLFVVPLSRAAAS